MDKDNKTTSSSTPLNGSSGLSKLSIFIGAFIAFMTLISLIILGYSVENYNSINTMDSCTNPAVVVSPNPKVSLPDATCNPVCNFQSYPTDAERKSRFTSQVLQSLMGDMYVTLNTVSNTNTLISTNQGAINLAQQKLCDLTNATNTVNTIFQYNPPNLTRIITTVPDQNGKYAGCTTLPTTVPSYDYLIRGESYYGQVTLLGKNYYGSYVPIFDMYTSIIIGAYFTGAPL